MSRTRLGAICAGLFWVSAAQGATFVVHAGHMIDVDHGKVLDDQAIRVEDGKITRIEVFSDKAVAGAKVVDWSHHTVVPGLIDMHAHARTARPRRPSVTASPRRSRLASRSRSAPTPVFIHTATMHASSPTWSSTA